jgi:hypothetical protein
METAQNLKYSSSQRSLPGQAPLGRRVLSPFIRAYIFEAMTSVLMNWKWSYSLTISVYLPRHQCNLKAQFSIASTVPALRTVTRQLLCFGDLLRRHLLCKDVALLRIGITRNSAKT